MTLYKIAPSILAADFVNLERDVRAAVSGGADYIHVDVMDGRFVDNLTIGAPVVAALARVSDVPLDVHLMIKHPSHYVRQFALAGAGIITIHAEAPDDASTGETLEMIRESGCKAGLALKPNTDIGDYEEYIKEIDLLLVMTVEPGYGAQPFLPESMERIRAARAIIDRVNPECELEIDGGIYPTNIAACAEAGANVFVMGTAVFSGDPRERIGAIRKALGG